MQVVVKKFGGNTLRSDQNRLDILNNVRQSLTNNEHPVIVVSAIGRKGEPYATDTLLSFIRDLDLELTDRERDLLISTGEIISACVLAGYLHKNGLKASALTGKQAGILTTDNHGNASILSVNTAKIHSLIENGIIPVITGFQGANSEGDITTLGRGGSDTSAIALGLALKALRTEIFTDVTGIYSADPHVVENAKLLKTLSYEELFQMAHSGAKVVNMHAVQMAMDNNVPLTVGKVDRSADATEVISITNISAVDQQKVITALSSESGLVQVQYSLLSPKKSEQLYLMLASSGVSLDMINISPYGHLFVIHKEQFSKLQNVNEKLSLTAEYRLDLGKITCIGMGMHKVPGVFSRIVSTLVNAEIEIIQTADSHMTITCLLQENEIKHGLEVLHHEFIEENCDA